MALIEIVDLRGATLPKDRVRGFAIDGPRLRAKQPEERVEFNGWIVGHPLRAEAVDLRLGAETLHRMPVDKWRMDVASSFASIPGADRSGFKEWVDLSALGPAAELQLVAVFADGGELPLGMIALRWGASALASFAAAAEIPTADLTDRGESVVLPRASVIIPVHGRGDYTRQCLQTLLSDASPGPAFEVIVVDDASPDDTAALLAGYGEKIRVVRLGQNSGFAGACNAGAAASRGDYLIFLNNDTVPQPGWLGGLVGAANVNPAATVVGAKLLFPDHTIQHAGVAFGLDRFPHHLYAGFAPSHPAVSKPRRFQAVTAACCLIRRGAFQSVGGFDRAFANGWEDVDLCLRLGQRGHEIHYAPQSVVYHFESMSRDLVTTTERHNRELYARRWRSTVEPDLLRFLVDDGLLTLKNETALYPLLLEVSSAVAVVKTEEETTELRLLEQADQIALLQRAVAELQDRLWATERRSEPPTIGTGNRLA